MAHDCPARKHQQPPSGYRQPPSASGQQHFGTNLKKPVKQGFRKFNKPKGKFQYTTQICTAKIEEIEEPEDDSEDKGNVASLAACTTHLSEDQRKEWLTEIKGMGINF